MKKLVLVCLALFIFVLSACTPHNPYTEDSYDETDINDFKIFEKKFVSEYYRSIGERGLKQIMQNTPVTCMYTTNWPLLYANTPSRIIFKQSTAANVWYLMEYDKLKGTFSYACHDNLCDHTSCMFSTDNTVYSGENHLFFISDDKYYVAGLDGSNIKEFSLPNDARLLSDTEKGVYWEKTEYIDETWAVSLWLYNYASDSSEQLIEATKNAFFYVIGDTVYMQDTDVWDPNARKLYRFSEDFSQKTEVADNISNLSRFGGSIYDYDGETGVLRKLDGDKMVTAANIPSGGPHWVGGGYIYYCCADMAQIESYRDDDDMYKYVSEYNKTCGNVYRIKEFDDTPELVYHGSHDGKPDSIEYIFADGEVLYIQYKNYRNFPNNFNKERGVHNLVILDVTTGKSIDITNEKSR